MLTVDQLMTKSLVNIESGRSAIEAAKLMTTHKVGSVFVQKDNRIIGIVTEPDIIRKEAARVLASYGRGHGHVFNLGHGVSQFTDPDHVGALVDAVHELSVDFHRI